MVWCRATFITSNNNHYYLCFSLIFACYQRPKMFTFSYLCPLFLILLVRFSFPSTSITHTWFWTYLLSSQSVTLLHVSHLHIYCQANLWRYYTCHIFIFIVKPICGVTTRVTSSYLLSSQSVTLLHVSHLHIYCQANLWRYYTCHIFIFIVKPICDVTTRVTSSLLLQYECLPARPNTTTSSAYKRHCLVLCFSPCVCFHTHYNPPHIQITQECV